MPVKTDFVSNILSIIVVMLALPETQHNWNKVNKKKYKFIVCAIWEQDFRSYLRHNIKEIINTR